ncbi:MAG: hypothetical protein K2Y26_12645 [Gemmatimonadaceae bacterium]|nr:hypothetical protein [Gemmatimonadaceae bacterium]
MKRVLLFAALMLASGHQRLAAQWNLARLEPGDATWQVSTALDPAIITSIGYRQLRTVFGARTQFGVEAGVVAGNADIGDYRARLEAGVQVYRRGSFRTVASAAFLTRGTSNTVFRGTNFGADVGITAGMYRPRWFVAGETGYDKPIVTHVTHTQGYRRTYYADAKDGWYIDTGGTRRLGVVTGTSLRGVELMLRAGVARTRGGEALVAPGYATLGMGFRF